MNGNKFATDEKTSGSCEGADFSWLSSKVSRTLRWCPKISPGTGVDNPLKSGTTPGLLSLCTCGLESVNQMFPTSAGGCFISSRPAHSLYPCPCHIMEPPSKMISHWWRPHSHSCAYPVSFHHTIFRILHPKLRNIDLRNVTHSLIP